MLSLKFIMAKNVCDSSMLHNIAAKAGVALWSHYGELFGLL